MADPIISGAPLAAAFFPPQSTLPTDGELLTPEAVKQQEEEAKKAQALPPKKEEPKKVEPPKKEEPMHQLREAHKAARKEADELKAQLTDFEGTKKERDELKAQLAEAQTKIEASKKIESVAALEASDYYQEKYGTGRTSKIANLKELASIGDINPDDLIDAINKTGKEQITALEDLIGSAPSILKGKIVNAIDDLVSLDKERKKELSEAQTALEKRVEENRVKTRQQRDQSAAESKAAWDKVAARAKELGLTDDEISDAKEFFDKNKDREKAGLTIIESKRVSKLESRIKELEEETERYRGANPSLGTGGGKGEQKQGTEPTSMFEAITGRKPVA